MVPSVCPEYLQRTDEFVRVLAVFLRGEGTIQEEDEALYTPLRFQNMNEPAEGLILRKEADSNAYCSLRG